MIGQGLELIVARMDYLPLACASTHRRIGGRVKTIKSPATPAALRPLELA